MTLQMHVLLSGEHVSESMDILMQAYEHEAPLIAI